MCVSECVYVYVTIHVCIYTCTYIYRITGYLCNSEICAFWHKKRQFLSKLYLCVTLHGGVALLTINIIIFVRFHAYNHINIIAPINIIMVQYRSDARYMYKARVNYTRTNALVH